MRGMLRLTAPEGRGSARELVEELVLIASTVAARSRCCMKVSLVH
jgi:hypothetical protein